MELLEPKIPHSLEIIPPKRIHFSLRALLIVVTLTTIAAYWFVARPTILANRFATAVATGDFDSAKSLLNKDFWPIDNLTDKTTSIDRVHAEVLPRDLLDLLAARRRIVFQIGQHDEIQNRRVDWLSSAEVVARPYGLIKVASSIEKNSQ
jgi:hypothetical protein